METFQILNTGDYFPVAEYQRHWFEPGMPMSLGAGCVMQLMLNDHNGVQEPVLLIRSIGKRSIEIPLTSSHIDLLPWSKLYCIPRAVERDAKGNTLRAFLEFITLVKRQPVEVFPCAG